jgi:hypothetical protein
MQALPPLPPIRPRNPAQSNIFTLDTSSVSSSEREPTTRGTTAGTSAIIVPGKISNDISFYKRLDIYLHGYELNGPDMYY